MTHQHPLHIDILTSLATLRAPGPRARVLASEATAIALQWTDQIARGVITTIDLSCRAWPLETLEILRPLLEQIRGTVKTLKLDDVIASLPTNDGFRSLRFFAEVFHRDQAPLVENVFLNSNALGSRFLDENFEHNCRDLIAHPNLKRLDFNNCGMSVAVATELTTLLQDTCHQLLELRLGKNQMHPEGAQIIGALLPSCTCLQQLDYGGSRPLLQGTACLSRGLRGLAEACGNRTSLTELNLKDSNFGNGSQEDHPVHDLCAVLRASPHIQWLRLWDCDLEGDGLQLIVDALIESQAKLELLDVGCAFLGEEARDILIEFIRDYQTDTLAELYAEDNALEDDGVEALLEVLSNCPNLRCLKLSGNDTEEEGYIKVSETNLPNLQKLWVHGDCTDDLDEDLVAKIRGLCAQVVITDTDPDLEDLRNPNYAISADAVALAPDASDAADAEVEAEEGGNDEEVDDLAAALGAAQI